MLSISQQVGVTFYRDAIFCDIVSGDVIDPTSKGRDQLRNDIHEIVNWSAHYAAENTEEFQVDFVVKH